MDILGNVVYPDPNNPLEQQILSKDGMLVEEFRGPYILGLLSAERDIISILIETDDDHVTDETKEAGIASLAKIEQVEAAVTDIAEQIVGRQAEITLIQIDQELGQ